MSKRNIATVQKPLYVANTNTLQVPIRKVNYCIYIFFSNPVKERYIKVISHLAAGLDQYSLRIVPIKVSYLHHIALTYRYNTTYKLVNYSLCLRNRHRKCPSISFFFVAKGNRSPLIVFSPTSVCLLSQQGKNWWDDL